MTAEEFRKIRQGLQLSQQQLAQRLYVRQETISRAETGERPISLKMAHRLLDMAGMAVCPTCGHPTPTKGA